MPIGLALALAMLVVLTACTTVPVTGRSQLSLISDAELAVTADQTYAQFLHAALQRDAVLSGSESLQAATVVDTVRRASDRIIDAAGLRGQHSWETVVVKFREPNAFVMPNGKIVVFAGLIPVAKTEAALAAVIGHEVGHVVARHQAERVSQVLLAQLGLAVLDAALAASNSQYGPVIGAALGLGAQYGLLLPFSREHESEADRLGLLYMAKAGYDPSEAVTLWERMEAAGGSGPWEFLSTHPSPATRRARIQQWLPEAMVFYADPGQPLPASARDLQALRTTVAARAALAPTAARPVLTLGYWTQVTASDRPAPVTTRLERIERCELDHCFVETSDDGRATTYTADYHIVEIRSADGSWERYTPPLRAVQWPMRAGDSWLQILTAESSDGRRREVCVKGDVVRYELIRVPAGSFMAFKITLAANGARFSDSWYAPETRTFVRHARYDVRDARGDPLVVELVDYQRSASPAGEATPAGVDDSLRMERPIERPTALARAWLAMAQHGDVDAQNNIALLYRRGPQSFEDALKWYRRAAEAGSPSAQNALGSMYHNGEGVDVDYVEAVKWLRLAAEQGHAIAQNTLGAMYAMGRGVSQDAQEALKWHRRAAEQRYALAEGNLAVAYARGDGVPQSLVFAYMWYDSAVSDSHGTESEEYAKRRDEVAARLTASELETAREMSRQRRLLPRSRP